MQDFRVGTYYARSLLDDQETLSDFIFASSVWRKSVMRPGRSKVPGQSKLKECSVGSPYIAHLLECDGRGVDTRPFVRDAVQYTPLRMDSMSETRGEYNEDAMSRGRTHSGSSSHPTSDKANHQRRCTGSWKATKACLGTCC